MYHDIRKLIEKKLKFDEYGEINITGNDLDMYYGNIDVRNNDDKWFNIGFIFNPPKSLQFTMSMPEIYKQYNLFQKKYDK